MDLARIIQFEAPPTVPRLSTSLMLAAGENEGFKRFLLEKPTDPTLLNGKRFAILSTDGVEELELTVPYRYLEERGATVHLIAPRYEPLPAQYGLQYPAMRDTHILTVRFMENSGWFKFDKFLDEVTTRDYDVLIIPGGAWNPDTLRLNPAAVSFITEMYDTGKLTTAICHGPVVLINTGLLRGRTVTGIWNIQLDLKNAGATVVEQPVVVDGHLITGRSPYDLPQYLEAIVEAVLKPNEHPVSLAAS
jgi:protease I